MSFFRKASTLLILMTLPLSPSAFASDRITDRPFVTRSEVIAANGMASTSHPLATQIAVDILKQGGNAIDAAIAANAALGLMEPTGCGIGGDMFAIVWDAKTEKLYGYNGSGRSPKSLTYDKLMEELDALGVSKIPAKGVLPISVPGCVDGWFALHDRFGKLPMQAILDPAVKYSREGFPITEVIGYYWGRAIKAFGEQPGFLEVYAKPNGEAPQKGELWKNPALADTLEAIGKQGRDAFYKGDIAKQIASFVQEHGGYLSYNDLVEHEGEWVEPLSTNYRGIELWELPPNGQGIAALQMLNVLEHFDFSEIPFGSAEHIHLFTEAKKLAFADRAKFYSDPAFNDLPIDKLISKTYGESQKARIDPNKAAKSVATGLPNEGDTIYLSVADKDGNMVSFIQSNYRGHGSGVTPPTLGFCLQDRGELFHLDPDHLNVYEPGKRPFQTIIPAFITKGGEPWVSFGVMGGATQPQAHVQIVMNLVDFGMNLQEAGDAPRIVHTGSVQPTGGEMTDGGELHLESGFSDETLETLKSMGHTITDAPGIFGGYQAVMLNEHGLWVGASESRKDGHSAGY
jgi:gamma-glutamyltranspeptidase/glutathione hydrolase